MKLPPQKREEVSSATVAQALWLTLGCSLVCALTAAGADPSWWSSTGTGSQPAVMAEEVTTNSGVVTTNYVPNPYAVVAQGQVKQFASRSVDYLNSVLPAGAGTNLNAMVSNWAQDYLTNGYNATNIKPSDYTAMNVGQLKSIAGKVYGRLAAVGYPELTPSWLHQNTNTDNLAANLGQLKQVFDFDLSLAGASGLTATPNGSGSVNLSWPLPSTNNVTSWIIEQQNSDGSWAIINTLTNSATSSYTVTGLTNGPSYTFQVIGSTSNSVSVPARASGVTGIAATPTVSVAAGTYASEQTITLDTLSPGAMIYYTLDGSTPTTSSFPLSPGGKLIISHSETLKAIAAVSGLPNSATLTAAYTITSPYVPVSGLVSWWRADSGVIQDGSGNVNEWTDQMNAYPVTQTGTTRPTFVASDTTGRPALSFNGSQWLYNSSNMGSSVDGGITMIVVGTTTVPNALQESIFVGAGGPEQNRGMAYYLSKEGLDTCNAYVLGGAAPVANTYTEEALTVNAGLNTTTFFQNGTQTVSAAFSGFTNVTAGVTVGACTDQTAPWQGNIAEVLIYDHQLSSTDYNQVDEYLSNKYGFYSPNATWPLAYSTAVQAEITRGHWNKRQADSYAALQAASLDMPTTGLVVWLNADKGVTTSGTLVTSLTDQASGYILSGGVSGQPTYVLSDFRGHAGIRFSGGQSLTTFASLGTSLNSDITIVTVGSTVYPSGEGFALYLGQNTATGANRDFLYYSGYEYFDTQGPGCYGGAIPPIANTLVSEVVTLDPTLTNVAFYQNNVHTLTTTVSGLQNVVAGITMGNATSVGAGYGWRGDIYEQLVYDHQLSSAELQQLSVYLAAKYGVPVPAPTISPNGGTSSSSTTVTLSSPPSTAVVRYTLDGTTPTVASPIYSSPVTLTRSCPLIAAVFFGTSQISPDAVAQFYVADSGSTGISDAWQTEYFGHTGIDPSGLAPGGSGLTNLQAYLYGYNPNLYSTNGDGLSDLINYELGYSATDTDINGYTDANGNPITNAQQLAMGLDPFDVGVNPPAPTPPTPDPSDHTAPIITLYTPAGATLIP